MLLLAAPALSARATTRSPELTTAIAFAIATEIIDATGVESGVEIGVEGGESEMETGIANTTATETIGNETVAGTLIVVAKAAVSAAAEGLPSASEVLREASKPRRTSRITRRRRIRSELHLSG